jgi:hypothetical protein
MRIATKNEILVMLGSCITTFSNYCVSPGGAAIKFIFDNTSNFNLDSEVVMTMVSGLKAGGIVDDAVLERFSQFGTDSTPFPTLHTYRVPHDYPVPGDARGYGLSVTYPGCLNFVVPYPINDGIAVEEAQS